MSTIFFMAFQCCQCSTMQVKQRKKNSKSNKWVCVVCNQRQSIRKVFAEAAKASDLRPFVQSFNMSRSADPAAAAADDDPPSLLHSNKRPRSDWTEFLDPDDQVPEPAGGGGSEPEIVTEMPVQIRNASKRALSLKEGEEPSRCRRLAEASKWRRYVTPEDQGVGAAGELAGPEDEWRILMENEEEVGEEEVHPDFL